MRRMMFLTVLALVSCARPGAPGSSDAFARELAGRTAGAPVACISALPSQNLRVIDAQTIAYDRGSTIYVNRLASACPAIEPLNTLIVEPTLPGQYCRNDHIRGNEPGSIIPGPTCFLQDWVPYKRP